MLDPLTAVSLAATVVQFVDFTSKVVSKTIELRGSAYGSSNEVYSAEAVTSNLVNLSEKLKDGLRTAGAQGPLSEDDQTLENICNACISVSEKMLHRLKGLKVQQGDGKWKTMVQATKTVWSQKELDELATQLERFRSQLQLHVFVKFKENFDITALSKQPGLDDRLQCVLDALRDNRDVFESSIEKQATLMMGLHLETQTLTLSEHEKTRSVIIDAVQKAAIEPKRSRRRVARVEDHLPTAEEEAQRKLQAENRILASFSFPSIAARYIQVAKAHASTFEWIFKQESSKCQPSESFTRWLEFGDGIYWINGKAGSGKSTLMKFLYDHEQTRKLLTSWACPVKLDLGNFFFWNSGTADQKSQSGLLRSLLHEILSKHRDLIPIVLPGLWSDEYLKPTEFYQDIEWNIEAISEVFDILRTQNELRICLFIDGLDEYEGDRDGTYTGIVSLFKGLAASPSIKICLSSRPWLVFEDAFRCHPSLRLQDLTSNDITLFIEDKLNDHERMIQLRRLDPKNADALAAEIVSKSSGVFLWVTLVVKSLLDGLTNRDRISDLQKRLQLLPSDLEELYKHMLFKHISPFYYEQSSQILGIFRAATSTGDYHSRDALELITLVFADEEDENLSLTAEVRPLTDDDLLLKCNDTTDRLKSRCAGLLEVSGRPSDPFDLKINFLHRTVQDFLKKPDIWDLVMSRAGIAFNPDERLLKSYILQLKYVMMSKERDGFRDVSGLVSNALKYARRSRDFSLQSNEELLDELDKTVAYHWMSVPRETVVGIRTIDKRNNKLHWASELKVEIPDGPKSTIPYDDFLSLTIEYGLLEYVQAKLDHDSLLLKQKAGRPLLDYLVSNAIECPPPPELASLLLQYGADPNHKFNGATIWQRTIIHICGLSTTDREKNMPWKSIFKIFLDAGADPDTLARGVKKPQRGKTYHTSSPSVRLHLATPLSVVSKGTKTSTGAALQVPFPDKELELRLQSSGARYINTWMDIKNQDMLDDEVTLQATVDEYLSDKRTSTEGDLTDDSEPTFEKPAFRLTVAKERIRDKILHSKSRKFLSEPHESQSNTTMSVAGSEGAGTKSKRRSIFTWIKGRE